jgi:hypothetical protein
VSDGSHIEHGQSYVDLSADWICVMTSSRKRNFRSSFLFQAESRQEMEQRGPKIRGEDSHIGRREASLDRSQF